jgi:hypothetical protein
MHQPVHSPTLSLYPDSFEEFLQSDTFLQQAEDIIFTPQQPEFHDHVYTNEVLAITNKKKIYDALVAYWMHTIQVSFRNLQEAYIEPCKQVYRHFVKPSHIAADSSSLELPHLVMHPQAGEQLVNSVDTWSPEKLEALQTQLPNVTVRQEIYTDESWNNYNAFTDQQIYEIYNVLARYGNIVTKERIEIRPAKQRIFGKKVQNTMRTVSIPADANEQPHFKTKRDMFKRALYGITSPKEWIEITWFNTSNQKNIASVGNLDELWCSLAGIFGHEAPHIRQGMERNTKQKRAFTSTYLLDKAWRSDLERINDAESVLMGHGLDLYTFKMIVDANSQPQFVSKKFEEYMVPKQILRLMFYIEKQYRDWYDQLLQSGESVEWCTRGYFAPELLDQARQLFTSEDRKDINKYKFPENTSSA